MGPEQDPQTSHFSTTAIWKFDERNNMLKKLIFIFEIQDVCGNRTEYCNTCRKYIRLRELADGHQCSIQDVSSRVNSTGSLGATRQFHMILVISLISQQLFWFNSCYFLSCFLTEGSKSQMNLFYAQGLSIFDFLWLCFLFSLLYCL